MVDDFRVHGMASVLDANEERDVLRARFASTGRVDRDGVGVVADCVDRDGVGVIAHCVDGDVVSVRTIGGRR
ncbi:hypothetical protein D3C73_1607850 [compost metagenome]